MSDITNYTMRELNFKIIEFKAQIAKDRLYGVSKSLIVLQKNNLSNKEFDDLEEEIIKKLKYRHKISKLKVSVTPYHKILVVSD